MQLERITHTSPKATKLSLMTVVMVMALHFLLFGMLAFFSMAAVPESQAIAMSDIVQITLTPSNDPTIKPISNTEQVTEPVETPVVEKKVQAQEENPTSQVTPIEPSITPLHTASGVLVPKKKRSQSATVKKVTSSERRPVIADKPLPERHMAPSVTHTAPMFDASYLDNPAPVYPQRSRAKGEEGSVMLRVFVEPSGLPSQIEVHGSSGFTRLDSAAITAVRRWHFTPAQQNGMAVGAWVLVPIVFSLKEVT